MLRSSTKQSHANETIAEWAVIERFRIAGPFALCKSGNVFIDSPGLSDGNPIRATMASKLCRIDSVIYSIHMKRALESSHLLEYIRSNYEQRLVFKARRTSLIVAITHCDVSDSKIRTD